MVLATGDDFRRASERLRYLRTFVEHMAFAAALKGLLMRAPRQQRNDPPRVAFLSAYPRSHYGTVARFGRWLPHLIDRGWDPEILTPSTEAQWAEFESGDSAAVGAYYRACLRRQWSNLRRASEADVVVLHRGLLPFSPWQRPTFEQLLARMNARLVYDFYDAIWLQRQGAARQPSRVGRWLHPPDKIEAIMGLARVVTVSNESLADWARLHHGDVRVVPMLLDVESYTPRRHEQRSPVVLGWLGNRHQIPRLLALAPALRRLTAEREILLRVVTSRPVHIPGVLVESQTHRWSEASERRDLAGIDIGLLPLENSAHDRGKSPLKLLQYSAAGLAVVASGVAIDQAIFRPGESFLAASDEESWLQALTCLVDDPALRARLGGAARVAVDTHYSFAGHANAFDRMLRAAADPEARVEPIRPPVVV